MSDSNVIKLAQPGVFTDSLTEVLRSGARALLTQAVEAEVAEVLAKHADLKSETGHRRVVRRYAAALGLDRGYSAHSMRATFITTALENGAQLEDVQKAAGHRDPSTTKLYEALCR